AVVILVRRRTRRGMPIGTIYGWTIDPWARPVGGEIDVRLIRLGVAITEAEGVGCYWITPRNTFPYASSMSYLLFQVVYMKPSTLRKPRHDASHFSKLSRSLS